MFSPPLPDFAATCWFLTGPTASGKTELALTVAEQIGGEIVSLDSMALYRRMDIGTAKPSLAERARVPHHLIDVIEPHEEYSLAQYVAAAGDVVRAVQARGRQVLFVGGTPLYLKALLRGIFEGPPADWEFRSEMELLAAEQGDTALHERLRLVDPAAAEKLHLNDHRRVIRALEVQRLTGKPISQLQQQFERARDPETCRVYTLQWPREELGHRIDLRVEAMFSAGLVDEVQGLLSLPEPLSRTARQAVGYREVISHLQGEYPLERAMELVKTHTRQFAKRQGTWFRSLQECRPLPVTATEPDSERMERLAAQIVTWGNAVKPE